MSAAAAHTHAPVPRMPAPGAPCPGCEDERTDIFVVEGLCCATEASLVQERLSRMDGVCSVQASPLTGKATVVHTLDRGRLVHAFTEIGFTARAEAASPVTAPGTRATLAALFLTLGGAVAGLFSAPWAVALYLPAILVGGFPVARRGWQRARQGSLDMNALMTIAVLGAMAIGEWGEGASTVVLFSLAQLLEARSLERARRAITGLMSLAPETALVRRGPIEERLPVAQVARGELFVVAPGERIALDGLVAAGTSEVDQSPLTGESRKVDKTFGDSVFAGSINGSGALEVTVTRGASETTLARVLRRVEEAQASRAPSQSFVDAFARIYTPAAVVLAAVLAVVPPLLGAGTFAEWGYRALVLLVIACPCALVISTPVSIVSALTAASRMGVLVKGGAHLEEMGRVREVVFDKTGTLTRGEPRVTDVIPARGETQETVLALAAAVETRSAHPVGEALAAHARHTGLAFGGASEVTLLPGRGVRGRVGGDEVLVGSHRLFDEEGLCDHRLDGELRRLEEMGRTTVLVGTLSPARRLLGVVAVGDRVREEAAEAVADLLRLGIEVSMLTGDNARTAEAIAGEAGISRWAADLLPDDKVAHLRARCAASGSVAMVGDGVNDAPALAVASVGIAMGRRGTDIALETADVALMADDLRRVPALARLGRAARRTIAQNIALSLLVKAAVLVLAVAGYGTLWAAVAADMGASFLVIANGLRLLGASPGQVGGHAPSV